MGKDSMHIDFDRVVWWIERSVWWAARALRWVATTAGEHAAAPAEAARPSTDPLY